MRILGGEVKRGDSGGPLVAGEGQVAGVVFAAAVSERNTGYALTADSVRDAVQPATGTSSPVATGSCRFE